MQLDEKFPHHVANERLTYDLHDENWILQIGIKTINRQTADTKIQATKN